MLNKSSKSKSLSELFFELTLAIISIPIGVLLTGFCISKLWLWYVANPFGLPALTIVGAWGASLIVTLLTTKLPTKPDGKEDFTSGQKIIASWIFQLIILFYGWVGTFFL